MLFKDINLEVSDDETRLMYTSLLLTVMWL